MRLFDFRNSTSGMRETITLYIATTNEPLSITSFIADNNTIILQHNTSQRPLRLEQFNQQTDNISVNLKLIFQVNPTTFQNIWGFRIIQNEHHLLLK